MRDCGPVDLRYAQINRSSETARNQSILLNIVRATAVLRWTFILPKGALLEGVLPGAAQSRRPPCSTTALV
jgi:hypothetical protein